MKRVITFSLWGDNPTYNIGAIRNAEDAINVYPGFECWFYIHEPSVPKETVEKLRTFNHVTVILKTGDLNTEKPMMWRFEAIDDPEVEIMMSRDTDTRIWLREQLAVKEWIHSGAPFHIMRDHMYHRVPILGGMFGTRKLNEMPSWKTRIDQIVQVGNRDYDQTFLAQVVYPLVKDRAIIHASFHKWEPHAKPFPIPFCPEFKFVGEYVYADESRNQQHVNMIRDHVASGSQKRSWSML
jgi:hypothetical protein